MGAGAVADTHPFTVDILRPTLQKTRTFARVGGAAEAGEKPGLPTRFPGGRVSFAGEMDGVLDAGLTPGSPSIGDEGVRPRSGFRVSVLPGLAGADANAAIATARVGARYGCVNRLAYVDGLEAGAPPEAANRPVIGVVCLAVSSRRWPAGAAEGIT